MLIGAVNTFKEKRTGDSAAVCLKTYYAADDRRPLGEPPRRQPADRLDEHQRLPSRRSARSTDPNTGEPIILPGRRVLIAPQIQALA